MKKPTKPAPPALTHQEISARLSELGVELAQQPPLGGVPIEGSHHLRVVIPERTAALLAEREQLRADYLVALQAASVPRVKVDPETAAAVAELLTTTDKLAAQLVSVAGELEQALGRAPSLRSNRVQRLFLAAAFLKEARA